MSQPTTTNTQPCQAVLLRVLCLVVPAAALPALAFASLLHISLTSLLAVTAYWVAESGGTWGIPILGILLTALVVTRPGLSPKQRLREVLTIVLIVVGFLGGGALLNEHVIKPTFAMPRPNILELATQPPDAPVLKLSTEAFYALPGKAARSEYLRGVLTPEVPLHPLIREHWIAETGFSFPSGHSFSALFFATFFLAMGLTLCEGKRRWGVYWLPVWAAAVCFSRILLRVHSPTDVCVGAVEGIVVGGLGYLFARRILAVRGL